MAKTTGLAAFTRRTAPAVPSDEPSSQRSEAVLRPQAVGRRRGQGATVALTVRISRPDWERLHQLAVSEGVSLQELAVRGLSQVFAAKGLPGIGS
jgi:hypothetical protein